MGEFHEPESIALYLNEDTYRGNIHNSTGPAIVHGLNGDIDMAPGDREQYEKVFGGLEPDHFISEGSYDEQGLIAEDFLMIDKDQERAVLLQSKSYGKDVEHEVEQIERYLSYLRGNDERLYSKVDGSYIVRARASGIEDPQFDFPQVEDGIGQEIWEDDSTVRIYAEISQVVPELGDINQKVTDGMKSFI